MSVGDDRERNTGVEKHLASDHRQRERKHVGLAIVSRKRLTN